MKIDKNTIDKLCSMPDDKLWGTLKLFASANGINLSGKRMTSRDIAKLRAALASLNEADISRATQIINIYKNGGSYGRK